jgi:DNA-binding MarR family transcriptional regulator
LSEREKLAVNDFASRISLAIAAGRAIDALYRSGPLTRREDEIDRRIERIGLTDRGSIVIAEILHVRQQVAERFGSDLNDDERIALEGAVATIAALTSAHFPVIRGSCDSTSSSKEPSA